MADGRDQYTARLADSIAAIDAADWDRCAGGRNPFVSHAFLNALEESGSVGDRTGWWPQHLVLEDDSRRIVGCMPLYLKNNSYGEYVFDHSWAHALEQAGGDYYPKLQAAVPFTPAPGPRLLVGDEPDIAAKAALTDGAVQVAKRMGVSSLHVTFCSEDDWQVLGAAGFLQRLGQQFHWHNRGYGRFDDFLGALASRKRKAIRKERRSVAESGIAVEVRHGDEMTPALWDAFYRFYVDTYDRKWGAPYLTRRFFELIGARMPRQVVMVLACRDGRPIAGAMNLRGSDALYGRNWGCAEDHPLLHFECCYYRAIDYAIEHGLARVEAGTQGPHKIQRGYLPCPTYSAHWIANAGFGRAVEDFLRRERPAVREEMVWLEREHSPYRNPDGDCGADRAGQGLVR
ncbi:MAG: GNAT family N-acetyltransferase [Alphaproteobacteria bacterium]